ncbi:hypothetical protein [Candidatus Berkiella aquae]|uniref:Uncharacterized protein n=1 Tax=Candidatus Berkiella aquae TaxID=295108 RepID=A0A0Q9YXC6_9GAMM|nr:hypothetical protein [Candidatus Berkiella aquae]MCS5711263.1 hypothetical protein [Candidatus Berkiella aquae]
MYVTILGALLVIMIFFVLMPCYYVNKVIFNKMFSYFIFLTCWYLIYAICELFDLPYFMLAAVAIAAAIAYGFDYLRKSKKIAFINRYFAE